MSNLSTDKHGPFVNTTEADRALEQLLVFMSEMISVVEEENGVLARGIPASLSIFTGRKNELADELDRWAKDMATHQRIIATADAKLRDRFMDTVRQLRAAMDENVERLRAAMEASRRRIDAVMNAVRNEIASTSPYGANGRVNEPRAHPVGGGTGIRI
jgi:flagellar biosynthesis/type III secretory pathway chaperone